MKYIYLYHNKFFVTHYKIPNSFKTTAMNGENSYFLEELNRNNFNRWLSSLQECKVDSDDFDKIIINIPDRLLEKEIIEIQVVD